MNTITAVVYDTAGTAIAVCVTTDPVKADEAVAEVLRQHPHARVVRTESEVRW
jgi:hypothetical protein